MASKALDFPLALVPMSTVSGSKNSVASWKLFQLESSISLIMATGGWWSGGLVH